MTTDPVEALRAAGCSSHMCDIMPPRGQGTNGPCRCLEDVEPDRRRALRRVLVSVRRALAASAPVEGRHEGQEEKQGRDMVRFEHRDERGVDRDEVVRVADRLGSLGWELVSVTVPPNQPTGTHRCDLYFKRGVESRPRAERAGAVGRISAPNNACELH